MNTTESVKQNLTNMLRNRYKREYLTRKEAGCELMENPKVVISTSKESDKWLIADIVEYLLKKYDR